VLFKTLYFKDIVEYNNLRDDYVFGLLTDALMSSTGSLTNPTKMANTLSTERGGKLDVHTVRQYLRFLTQSYLFAKAECYDVSGSLPAFGDGRFHVGPERRLSAQDGSDDFGFASGSDD